MPEQDNIYVVHSFFEFLNKEFPNPEDYVSPLIPRESGVLLFGRYKSGKSLLMERGIIEIAGGYAFLGIFPVKKPCRILYAQNEIADKKLQERMKKIYKALGEPKFPDEPQVVNVKGMRINTDEGYKDFVRLIGKTKPEIVILDSLYYALKGGVSDETVANHLIYLMDKILKAFAPLSLVLVHHQRKAVAERPDLGMEEMLGSAQLTAWPSSIMRIRTDIAGNKTFHALLRYAEDPDPVPLEINTKTLLMEPTVGGKKIERAEDSMLNLLQTRDYSREELIQELQESLNIKWRTVDNAIRNLKESGQIKEVEHPEDTRKRVYLLSKEWEEFI